MSAYEQRALSVISQLSDASEFREHKAGPYLEGNLRLLDTIECSADIMCCRYSLDGSHLAVGLCDGSIKIYGTGSTQMLYSLSDDDTTSSRLPVTQIRFIPHADDEQPKYEHILIASYASGHIKFWHYSSGSCLHTINELRQTLALTVNPTGTHFITAGASTQIHMYDVETKQKVSTMEPSECNDIMDGHIFRVFAMQHNPNHPHVFISGGWDDTVQLYCAQWLGKDSIICGGNDLNMARMIDRGTLNTTGMLVDLPQGVYCIDNDRQGSHPRIAIGSNRFIYRLRSEKRN